MDFKEFVDKLGGSVAQAVQIGLRSKKITAEILSQIGFAQCLKVLESPHADAALRQKALEQLEKLASTFEQWVEVYCHAPTDSELEQKLQGQIESMDASFEQWIRVCERLIVADNNPLYDSALMTAALIRLQKLHLPTRRSSTLEIS